MNGLRRLDREDYCTDIAWVPTRSRLHTSKEREVVSAMSGETVADVIAAPRHLLGLIAGD